MSELITGISSACFYPLETEKSVARCGELGFKNIEIFVNAYCELHGALQKTIIDTVKGYGLDVCSVHPFTSFAESYAIFGSYERRAQDSIEQYRHLFDFAGSVGAKYLVLHGGLVDHRIDEGRYIERYSQLYEVGKSCGITLTQENVVKYMSQSADFVKKMSDILGDRFAMTLDIKQCRRAGETPERFIELVGDKIVNVHVSDYTSERDCVPPFEGSFDFNKLYKKLNENNYEGKFLIELYSNGYKTDSQLVEAAKKLDEIIG